MFLKPIRIFFVSLIIIAFLILFFSLVIKTPKSSVIDDIIVPNNSMEQISAHPDTPVSWRSESWGVNTTKFTYLPIGHTGKHSLKTTITSYQSGDAKWYFDPQPINSGQTYTFTDYYEADVTSRVIVRFGKEDGTFIYKELKPAQPALQWTKYQVSFSVPTVAKTITVFHLLSDVGYLIIDDYQISTYKPEGFQRGLVSITWDDGIETQYTKALPLHKKYEILGNFFLISGNLDKKFYMTTAQAAEIQAGGNELGSHTVTHPHLPTLKDEDINRELQQSQIDLQKKFGSSFNDFVTPYGEYNDRVLSIIKKYYRSHRSVEDGYNAKNNFDIYNILVQNVYTTTPSSQVEEWVRKAKSDKTWLVLVYHQVDNPGDEYSVSSGDLESEFKYIKKSGIPVVTFDQAFKELLPQMSKN